MENEEKNVVLSNVTPSKVILMICFQKHEQFFAQLKEKMERRLQDPEYLVYSEQEESDDWKRIFIPIIECYNVFAQMFAKNNMPEDLLSNIRTLKSSVINLINMARANKFVKEWNMNEIFEKTQMEWEKLGEKFDLD